MIGSMLTDALSVSQVFELPGCDHRGASSDKRMLIILQALLGLTPPEGADLLRQQQYKRDQEAEAHAVLWGRPGASLPFSHCSRPSQYVSVSLCPLLSLYPGLSWTRSIDLSTLHFRCLSLDKLLL